MSAVKDVPVKLRSSSRVFSSKRSEVNVDVVAAVLYFCPDFMKQGIICTKA